ncbi:hypothetical protein M0R04_05775 [Candidatus Dojkabacteria bacterium]|jgi:hypothetical protein|nr:hypothetical protein [Candidatus Dojkabacteria bacterium]
MTGTVQGIVDSARNYIPDAKQHSKAVVDILIGNTAAATGNRETFYLKNSPIASVFLYVEPYTYTAASTFTTVATNSKVFLWAPSTLSCTFSDGDADKPHKPNKFKQVLATYEYTEKNPYTFSDTEISDFVPLSVNYLNNSFGFSFTSSGTGTGYLPIYANDNERELIIKATAVLVRRRFVEEQKSRGLGVRFRGPMHTIDSVAQMKDYQSITKSMETEIADKAANYQRDNLPSGQVIDVYTENIVTT